MTLNRIGNPTMVTVAGVGFLDCGEGCYDHLRSTPWAAGTAWSLWALTSRGRGTANCFYNGPVLGGGNTTDTSALYFNGVTRLFVGNIGYNASWSLPAAAGPESLEWTQPGGSTAALAQVSTWRNGAALTRAYLNNRAMSAAGAVFVAGGARNASGASIPGGLLLRDLVLTVGWVPNSSQRAALEEYRRSRI